MAYQLHGAVKVGAWWWILRPKNGSLILNMGILVQRLMPSIPVQIALVQIRMEHHMTSLAWSTLDHKPPYLMDPSSAYRQMNQVGYSDMIVILFLSSKLFIFFLLLKNRPKVEIFMKIYRKINFMHTGTPQSSNYIINHNND